MSELTLSPLGKESAYVSLYAPELLFTISRKRKREALSIVSEPPFFGVDVWRAFEVSWLNNKGKPVVAVAEFVFPCLSCNIVESKSLKLYLNSFNGTCFNSSKIVSSILANDLSKAAGGEVKVVLQLLDDIQQTRVDLPEGVCLDSLDVSCSAYQPDPSLLSVNASWAEEKLYSHLLKSNCPVTGQPDWATVEIIYQGQQIQHESLLRYIVSYRNHEEFHEHCVERMFMDILNHCKPERLMICARYTRRGGLDINPFRSSHPVNFQEKRFFRQ
jgi:7-cyano-7-deazaguanine reductase